VIAASFSPECFSISSFREPQPASASSVNTEKITVEEFNKEVEKVELPLRDMLREEPLQYLRRPHHEENCLQEAKKQGIAPPPKTYKDSR